MGKKFRGPELVKQIDEAMDKGLARFITLTQSKLSQANPVDTGRMASSWFIGQGAPNRSTRSENWAEPGAGRVRNPKPDFEITMKSDHWISNSLPYANRVATDPLYAKGGRRGAADWYTRIENNLAKDAERAFDYWLRKVK